MTDLAIIGGTGLTQLNGLEIIKKEIVHTPYGEPSGPLSYGVLNDQEVIFLARHGYGHTIPPHKINYLANISALKEAGAKNIIAIAAVGGITDDAAPGRLVIPDQIIDYTYSRQHTYFEEELTAVTHIDFTHPYSDELREKLIAAGAAHSLEISTTGTYGATQGPRLETAAEIKRMGQDGCTIVGMTGMPEAALARELELNYACCAVVANWCAGVGGTNSISMAEIEQTVADGMGDVRGLLEKFVAAL